MRDLSSPKRNPTSDAVEVQSPHHWATWEVLGVLFLREGAEKAPGQVKLVQGVDCSEGVGHTDFCEKVQSEL